jgi:Flp pilus assembly protein TadD
MYVPNLPIFSWAHKLTRETSAMPKTPFISLIGIAAALAASGSHGAWARDGRTITFPMRSQMSLVQRLNREGVEAVKKHNYEKAESLFYKAYLYDPADPFTLNNLGYISELEGQLDRAHKFYALAAEQGCDADIDLSNAKRLEGRPMKSALVDLQDTSMRVNRMNVNAMQLLSQDRGFEAAALLRQTLPLDPQNPFTLNNLGVADEAIGDYQGALKYYNAAASARSQEPAEVTLDRASRGTPVSRLANESARRLEKRMRQSEMAQSGADMLTVHGVFAANQNDWVTARQDFLRAYSLDPRSAFSLNNLGYVAEKDGDLETAEFFYQRARKADNSEARIGFATQSSAQGKKLSFVAQDSNLKVDSALDEYSRERRREGGPIELTPRDNAPATAPQ